MQFTCPLCQGLFEAETAATGLETCCPHCMGKVVLPPMELPPTPPRPVSSAGSGGQWPVASVPLSQSAVNPPIPSSPPLPSGMASPVPPAPPHRPGPPLPVAPPPTGNPPLPISPPAVPPVGPVFPAVPPTPPRAAVAPASVGTAPPSVPPMPTPAPPAAPVAAPAPISVPTTAPVAAVAPAPAASPSAVPGSLAIETHRAKIVKAGDELRQLRELTPEEKSRRRAMRSLMFMACGIIFLTVMMALLLKWR